MLVVLPDRVPGRASLGAELGHRELASVRLRRSARSPGRQRAPGGALRDRWLHVVLVQAPVRAGMTRTRSGARPPACRWPGGGSGGGHPGRPWPHPPAGVPALILSPAPIASRQSEQLPKSNAKYLPFGLMCSTKFTIPKTPPVAVRMTNLSVLVNTIASLASGSVTLPPNQSAPLIE